MSNSKKSLFRLFIVSFYFSLFFLLQIKSEASTPVSIDTRVDKTQATVGDTIDYHIIIQHAKNITIKIPDIKKNLSDFSIEKEEKSKSKDVDNMTIDELDYKIQAQDVGAYIIQPVEIAYAVPKNLENQYGKSSSVKSSKIYIKIESVLKPEDKKNDIKDIKPIESISVLNPMLLFGIIILLLGLGFLIVYIKKKLVKSEAELLPHEMAYKQLNQLKEEKLFEKGKSKEFYFKISEIARKYLKSRFDISALERPSPELEKDIEINQEINQNQKMFLKDFLETTDFYKYTDAVSDSSKADSIFEKVYTFVNDTKKLPETEKKS